MDGVDQLQGLYHLKRKNTFIIIEKQGFGKGYLFSFI